jgi:protein ImuB
MSALSRRYLSVWLRRLSTDRIERRSAAPGDAPLAIVAPVKSALRLTGLNDVAARLGLKTGMALADARAMYPTLAVADADTEGDRQTLEAIADWCDRYTPLIGLDPPDGLKLDVTGCAHLFGGEAALCRDLVRRLGAQGFQPRAAIADTFGAAWAAARYGTPGVVPKDATREVLLPLPVVALRITTEAAASLVQSGLKQIADLVERPRAPLAARFGQELIWRLDQALGRDEESIVPRLPLPSAMVERRFPDPIALESDVLGTIEQLARNLDRVLERRGEGARLLQVALFRADGKVHRLEVGTGAPVRDPSRIRRLFADRLTAVGVECDPGFGFDMVRLSALVTERCDPTQTGFGPPEQNTELAHLIDRLGARFGLRRVQRLVAQDTHIPEFCVIALPAHAVGQSSRTSLLPSRLQRKSPSANSMGERREGNAAVSQDSLAPQRPIRLFARPELIEAMAEVPDGPPVRFRWRQVLHEVTQVEGPERIAMQWWRDEEGRALTRDYFRVESRTGARVWLYREGLFGREVEHPRWYLHGLFG